jgi:hypothetical protein
MKSKKFLLGIPALALVFTMIVVGCETEDSKGALGGTTWSRVVNSNTSTMTIHYVFELTFIDASNAKILQTGYTQQSGKSKTNVNILSEYTYTYDTKVNADGWQGALKAKSSSNVGYVFKISGNTLTSMTSSGTVTWTKD